MQAFAAAFVAVVTAHDRHRRLDNRTAGDRWPQCERVACRCPRTDATDPRLAHCVCRGRHEHEYSSE